MVLISERNQTGVVPVFFLCLTAACTLAIGWLGLVYFGIAPVINADSPDLSMHGLFPLVLWHEAFGSLLFVGVIAAGLAALSYCPRHWRLISSDYFLMSLLAGLIVWLVICVGIRLVGGGSYSILGLVLAFIAIRARRIREIFDEAERSRTNGKLSWQTLTVIYLLGITLSAHFGMLWRLPSENVTGTLDLGDLAYFTGAYHALKISLFPWISLAVEGEYLHPFNQLQDFYALGFDDFPKFDISLFLTTSVPLFFFLSTGFVIAHIYHYRITSGRPPLNLSAKCVVILLICTAIRYPSWVVETPPLAFAVPLAVSIVYMIDRGKERPSFYYLAVPVAVIAFALSKVMMIVVLGLYGLSYLALHAFRVRSKVGFFALIVGTILVAILATLILYLFWTKFISFASTSDFGPSSLHTFNYMLAKGARLQKVIWKTLPAFSLDLGILLLVIGVWLRRSYLLFLSVLTGASLYYGYPYIFGPAAAAAMILTITNLLLATSPREDDRRGSSMFFVASAMLMLFSYATQDPGRWLLMLIWVPTLGGMLALVLLNDLPEATRSITGNRWAKIGGAWRYLLPTIGLLSNFAHANGDLRFSVPNRQIVPPELTELWLQLRMLTPVDSLTFTDQTGEEPDRLVGWNDYSMMAERQFFISSWATSFLRGNSAARSQRLQTNLAVLNGMLPAEQLQPLLNHHYGAYFAAVEANFPVPSRFERIFANSKYAIYRIPR